MLFVSIAIRAMGTSGGKFPANYAYVVGCWKRYNKIFNYLIQKSFKEAIGCLSYAKILLECFLLERSCPQKK